MSQHPRPVRVTVVDDHVLFAESVALTLEAEGYLVKRLDITAPPATLASVLATALRTVPRVVLLDLDLGRVGDGTRLIAPLTASGAAVVALTATSDLADWGESLRQGAKTVLSKASPLHEVMTTIRSVCDGRPVLRSQERQALIDTAVRERDATREIRTRLDRLTRREQEVLGALMRGEQVREIARARVVSEATVRTQIKSILAKLETGSQIAAIGAAYRAGWRPPG
ncbi:response regulator transcription factor [Nocardioides ginsengisoli]|uniref:LuxR C-terminal-related transcriptional regulator n=1 Tax=Nocardioides ginsengisoli TaxID=363868 RepID=A0ABW3VWA8_9ACTN